MKKILTRAALGLLVLAAALWLAGPTIVEYFMLHGVGLVARIVSPTGPTRALTWQPGPAEAGAPPAERPPNIVLILADDLGYNDLAWAGGGVAGGTVPTPNIDSIAREGVEFTAGYAGNATCAPSRAAILTGRYPTRFGFEFTPAPKFFMRFVARLSRRRLHRAHYFAERESDVPDMDDEGLPPSEITLAELLGQHGYHTLGFGKWHLGAAESMRPNAQGFDEWLGFRSGASMYLPANDPHAVNSKQNFDPIDKFLWANLPFGVRKDGGARFAPDAYMTDYLAREATHAIEANRNRPFFMYLAFNAPHTPLQALDSDYAALSQIANHRLRVYAAMIRALDRGVGRVLDALVGNGLENNTLVLFTSDNGGAGYIGLPDINKPYRGWKMTFFEGGLHAPFFMKWPAVLPAGKRFDAPVAHVDLFATAAAAGGAPLPADRTMDGVDLIPFVRAAAAGDTGPAPHERLFWRSGHYRALLSDGYKLQVSERPKRDWLFDLSSDPTERVDLSRTQPDRLSRLRAKLDDTDRQMVDPIWPSLVEGPIPIDKTIDQPEAPDDEYVNWAN